MSTWLCKVGDALLSNAVGNTDKERLKAKLSIYQSDCVSILTCGHELRLMTDCHD